jgi:hypothetical protein
VIEQRALKVVVHGSKTFIAIEERVFVGQLVSVRNERGGIQVANATLFSFGSALEGSQRIRHRVLNISASLDSGRGKGSEETKKQKRKEKATSGL